MKKILLAGKTDDMMKALNERLSAEYAVRFGSAVPMVLEAVAESFRPDLYVVAGAEMSGAGDSVRALIESGLSVVFGDTDSADEVCAAVKRLLPPDGDGETLRKTVMIVDDEAAILRLVKSMLEDEYNIMLAPSGTKALALMEKRRPDAVLLDCEMPVCDGCRTLELMRENSALADIPVIFLTGTADPERLARILALGPAGYIIKPAAKSDITAALSRALPIKER